MAAFLENIWQIILMAALLLASSFFSGSETAFFNISRRQLVNLKNSANRIEKLTAKILASPKQLLTALLFANMAVNVMYFALASVLSISLGKQLHPSAGGIAAVAAFIFILLFGEMLPKSLAYSHSMRFSIIASPACYICIRLLSPLLNFFDFAVVSPAVRLIVGPSTTRSQADSVTAEQLKILIDSSLQQTETAIDAHQLFSAVVELGMLKVRHIMHPRVDMTVCDITLPIEQVHKIMRDADITKMPVYKKHIDNIVGFIHLRDILLNPDQSLEQLLRKVHFVPEQKTLESLLEDFRVNSIDTAIAVDEYGGIAGIVAVEDIADELLGPIEVRRINEVIEQVGPLIYRLPADLGIHEWTQAFGIDPGQSRLATIGGLVTALLGRIPKAGDVAMLKNVKFEVETVKKHRIETLILSLEPITQKSK